jgi:hypothetical protein
VSDLHAAIAPSSASRWVQCPASVQMEARYPEQDSDKAAEGTLAHAVWAAMQLQRPIPDGATEEMLDGAEMMQDTVDGILAQCGPGVKPIVEYTLNKGNRMLFHADNWGTPDCTINAIPHKKRWVIDYKFGHRYVNPFENWQLLNYLILDMCNDMSGNIEPGIECHLIIVQPRSYHPDGPVREWVVMSDELWAYRVVLLEKALASQQVNPPAKTGSECRDCKARGNCATLQASGYEACEVSATATPFEIPVEAKARELALMTSAVDMLSARISGLEGEVLNHIKQGNPLPGWMTKQGEGRKKWTMATDEVLALGAMMGVDVSKPALLTPAQAVKAGLSPDVVDSYSAKAPGEIKLVRDTGAFARKIFQGSGRNI